MFKKFLLPVAFLLSFSSEASALTQSEKIKSCLDGTLSLEEEPLLIIEMQNWKVTFSPFVQNNTAACFTKLTGEPAEFINGEGLIIDQRGINAVKDARDTAAKLQQKAEATRVAQELEAAATRVAQEREALATRVAQELKAEAAEVALTALKSHLSKNIAKLEKHYSCVNAKRLDIDESIASIDQANSSIILRDTHQACSKRYAKDKNAVMMNQTCVDAFKQMGHPEIRNSAIEQQNRYSVEMVELLSLELALSRELEHYEQELLKVIRAGKAIPTEMFEPKVNEVNKLQSCAEFGYAGVYIK